MVKESLEERTENPFETPKVESESLNFKHEAVQTGIWGAALITGGQAIELYGNLKRTRLMCFTHVENSSLNLECYSLGLDFLDYLAIGAVSGTTGAVSGMLCGVGYYILKKRKV